MNEVNMNANEIIEFGQFMNLMVRKMKVHVDQVQFNLFINENNAEKMHACVGWMDLEAT